jgi:hypothetical protein
VTMTILHAIISFTTNYYGGIIRMKADHIAGQCS